MNNTQLARFLMAAMFQLARMVICSLSGDRNECIESVEAYQKLIVELDKIDGNANQEAGE